MENATQLDSNGDGLGGLHRWQHRQQRVGNLNVFSLTSAANGTLYAGTEAGVIVSIDGCSTWAAVNTGRPN